MINKKLIAKINFKHPAVWLATWGGCGLMQPAPGTWGTVGALPFGVILLVTGGWPALLAATIVVFIVGLWAAREFDAMTGEHDCSSIVIDEVAGMFIALMAAKAAGLSILIAFFLFRAFDVIKPWPISWCDKKLPGAWGVMMDDVVAGIFAAACLWGLQHYAGL